MGGRAPQLLAIKWAKLRESPFAFFRGTAPLFYLTWSKLGLPTAPPAWICGDAHLENVGSYKGDNRVPYFDLNDFDEACLAPAHWDLGRALTGLLLLGDAARARQFLESYRARLRSGKPQHIEPETARGVIATLLDHIQERRRKDFLASRVRDGKIVIRDRRTYRVDASTRQRALSQFRAWAKRQPDPAFYRVMDLCGRIAGNGSLGVERYVVLVHGKRRPAIMDMKQAAPSRRWRRRSGGNSPNFSGHFLGRRLQARPRHLVSSAQSFRGTDQTGEDDRAGGQRSPTNQYILGKPLSAPGGRAPPDHR